MRTNALPAARMDTPRHNTTKAEAWGPDTDQTWQGHRPVAPAYAPPSASKAVARSTVNSVVGQIVSVFVSITAYRRANVLVAHLPPVTAITLALLVLVTCVGLEYMLSTYAAGAAAAEAPPPPAGTAQPASPEEEAGAARVRTLHRSVVAVAKQYAATLVSVVVSGLMESISDAPDSTLAWYLFSVPWTVLVVALVAQIFLEDA